MMRSMTNQTYARRPVLLLWKFEATFLVLAAALVTSSAWAATTRLDCASISSTILGRSVAYCVALPPGYSDSASARYPALYYLHGLFD